MPSAKTPTDKIAELQNRLKAAKAEAKEAEQRQFAVIGAAVAKLLETDTEFKTIVLPKLQAVLTSSRDKTAIEKFLA
jgi:hypothetical protein